MTPSITVGWFPRERFEVAAESLSTLLSNTPPCRLIIIDCDIPRKYMDEIKHVIGKHEVEIISTGQYILPNQSRNIVVEQANTDYVALVENDILFPPQWLESLIAACEEMPADVASPLIYEGRGTKEHFDKKLGHIIPSSKHIGKYEVVPLASPRNATTQRTLVDLVELHCLVFRANVLKTLGPFEKLHTRDDIDLSMALHSVGGKAVLEPSVRINYVVPSWRPSEDELPYFKFRWDLESARRDRDVIRDRWNLVETPGDMGFLVYRNLLAKLPEVQKALHEYDVLPGSTSLLENGDWFGTDMLTGLSMTPFPNLRGKFGGFPPSDHDAVLELDRAMSAGCRRIIIGFPAYWWLDYLPEFREKIETEFHVKRSDELLQVFETIG